MSTTSDTILKAIFPPDGQTIPLTVARNWPAVEHAVKQLAAAMNGEQNDMPAAGKAARTPEWYAARNERIYRIMDENPEAPARELARLAGVSEGVIKNLSRRIHPRNVYRPENGNGDHTVEADEMMLIELKPIEKAEPAQAATTLSQEATTRNSRIVQESAEVKSDDATLRNVVATSGVGKEVTSEATKQPQNSHILDLTRKEGEYGRYVVPVPEDVVAEILRLSHEEGTPVRGISNTLAEKGVLIDWRRVRGVISNASRGDTKKHREEARKAEEAALRSAAIEDGFSPLSDQVRAAKCDPVHPEATASPSLPDVEGAPEGAARPAPKSITRADLNIRIWDAYQAGDSIEKISADLNSEGYYYDERQVRNRLRQQGADL
jgi:hypothetical protein